MLKKIALVVLLLMLAFVSYALWLRPNLILSADEAKQRVVQPSSKFITWKGNEIHYTDEGKGPVILMIHGYAGSHYNFQAITQQLKGQYRIIRPDLPGMGLSEFKDVNAETDFFTEYKDFFSSFISQLEIDSLYVMGNSLGGAMAAMVAATLPERVQALVLLNSAGYEMDKVLVNAVGPLRWDRFRPFLEKGMPMPVVKFGVVSPFADRSKVDPTEFPFDYAMANRAGVITHLFDLATSGQIPDTTLFKTIQAPTLIIWGEQDKIIPIAHVEKFQRDIPNSTIKIYDPCGHMPQMELPDSVVVDFQAFIEQLSK